MKKMQLISMNEIAASAPVIEILPTTAKHIRDLVPVLREKDRDEILAFGFTPEKALWQSYKKSLIKKTGFIDGKIAAVWGCCGVFLGHTGQPWLMTSDEIYKISPLKFARVYQREVRDMLELFPVIESYADSSYSEALRLLDVVGFQMSEPQPMGKNNALYTKFRKERANVGLIIRRSTISEIEASSNITELLAEYAAESAIKNLPPPSAKAETYKHLESTGALYTIAAFFDGALIGYITVLSSILPHYSKLIAVTESFFVTKRHRKTGAGLKLLREAERYAKALGSPGLLVSAPVDGDLVQVLPRTGYTETSRVFFRSFDNE